jgi:hypothetical protein
MSIVVKAFCREPSETRLTRGKSEEARSPIVVEALSSIVRRHVQRYRLAREHTLEPPSHAPMDLRGLAPVVVDTHQSSRWSSS